MYRHKPISFLFAENNNNTLDIESQACSSVNASRPACTTNMSIYNSLVYRNRCITTLKRYE